MEEHISVLPVFISGEDFFIINVKAFGRVCAIVVLRPEVELCQGGNQDVLKSNGEVCDLALEHFIARVHIVRLDDDLTCSLCCALVRSRVPEAHVLCINLSRHLLLGKA